MSARFHGFLSAAIVAAAFCFGSAAQAATCSSVPGGGYVSATPASSCLSFGTGAVNGAPGDPIVNAGYTLLDAFWLNGFANNGHLNVTGGADGHGAFSVVAVPNYFSYVLVFNNGDLGPGLKWGAFVLSQADMAKGLLTGDWALWGADGQNHPLSNGNLYGQPCPTDGCPVDDPARGNLPGQTPVPGAALLMGSVLASGAGFGAWRRRRTRTA